MFNTGVLHTVLILLASISVIIDASPVPEVTTELQNNLVCETVQWTDCKSFLQKHLDKDSTEYKQLHDIEDTYDSPLEPAYKGYVELIQLLLRNGIPINKKYDRLDETMLHIAAKEGHDSVVILLLTEGADIQVKDAFHNTPLHRAAKNYKTSTVKLLLDSGANVNTPGWFGNTPLHIAAEYDNLNTVKLLIERGANINASDITIQTPLHKATEFNNVYVVEYLVTMGCDKTNADMLNRTALDIAKEKNLTKIIDLLSEEKVDNI